MVVKIIRKVEHKEWREVMGNDKIYVPSRFESIVNYYDDYSTIFVKPKKDIKSMLSTVEKMRTQRGGALAILKGKTGIGKTTMIHSLPYYESQTFSKVISIPENIEFTDINGVIKEKIGEPTQQIKIVLLDGREIIDDETGLTNFLTKLNQLLRRRNDALVCWPVNNEEWYDKLVKKGREIGGKNFIPSQALIEVQGPSREKWKQALANLLIFMDKTLEELAVDDEMISEKLEESGTLGEFLEEIGDVVANRVSEMRKDNDLPELVFVLTSGKDLESEANRLRRAGSYILKAEELRSYSPKSEPGKFWKSRGKQSAQENLGYIITLFNAKLLTVKSTAVNYACKFYGNRELKKFASDSGMVMQKPNGKKAVMSTDLYKFIVNEIPEELTSTPKGHISDKTLKLYSKIQLKSATMHKTINEAICHLFEEVIGDEDKFKILSIEYDAGDGNLQVDVVAEINGEEYYLEFHHLSSKNCIAARISSYIMDKLRSYSQHYNLVKR